jgi:lysophospholipase L1-like esterase
MASICRVTVAGPRGVHDDAGGTYDAGVNTNSLRAVVGWLVLFTVIGCEKGADPKATPGPPPERREREASAAPATRPTTAPAAQPFIAEIRAFEAAERKSPSPTGAIVFVGSSSIRLWKTLKQDFPDRQVVNRGFGGSGVAHAVMYFDRIILPLKPKRVVFYSGENDIAGGKPPEVVARDFKEFVGLVHKNWPDVKVDYIAMKPSPSRWKLIDKIREGNRLIEAFTRTDARLSYIDVVTPMLGPDGKPREELFVQDKLHMNEKGYEIWKGLVEARLRDKP